MNVHYLHIVPTRISKARGVCGRRWKMGKKRGGRRMLHEESGDRTLHKYGVMRRTRGNEHHNSPPGLPAPAFLNQASPSLPDQHSKDLVRRMNGKQVNSRIAMVNAVCWNHVSTTHQHDPDYYDYCNYH
jgi:hypothetical protein